MEKELHILLLSLFFRKVASQIEIPAENDNVDNIDDQATPKEISEIQRVWILQFGNNLRCTD
jgi:thioredoxin-related protein